MERLTGTGCVTSGRRRLGWVGYVVHLGAESQPAVIQCDPPLDGVPGETFHLALEDGRILSCRPAEDGRVLVMVGADGHSLDRRQRRRLSSRALV